MLVWAASLWRFFLSLFFRFLLPLSLVLCKTSQRSTQNKYSIKQQVAFDTQTRCIHAHKPNHTLSCFFLFFSLFLSLVLTYITATLKQQHLHCNTPNNNCRVMKSDDRDRQNKNKNEKGTATFHMSSQMSVKHKLATRQLFLPGATRGKTPLEWVTQQRKMKMGIAKAQSPQSQQVCESLCARKSKGRNEERAKGKSGERWEG